jgi:hypothetical protein
MAELLFLIISPAILSTSPVFIPLSFPFDSKLFIDKTSFMGGSGDISWGRLIDRGETDLSGDRPDNWWGEYSYDPAQ